jgi:hypothetical protein
MGITRREHELLALVEEQGLTFAAAAARMGISVGTARSIISNLTPSFWEKAHFEQDARLGSAELLRAQIKADLVFRPARENHHVDA